LGEGYRATRREKARLKNRAQRASAPLSGHTHRAKYSTFEKMLKLVRKLCSFGHL
jgi:hypothetical protein